MKNVLLAASLVTMLLPAAARAQEPAQLNTARDLYASARYDEALALLNNLRGDHADRRAVEQYRFLCLLALGRTSEAEAAMAAVVTADPLYRPGEDAPPRVRTMFSEVRKRMLPEIAAARYAAAKSTYDRQDWQGAMGQFGVVLSIADDPDAGGKLNDLRLLAAGFLELSARAAAPPPEPPAPAPAASSAASPVAGSGRPGSPSASRNSTPSPRSPGGEIYDADDKQVVPPAIVRQEIPNVPASVLSSAKPRGLLEVVVDEKGRVVEMAIRGSIHKLYDAQLLAAARDWKYKPATLDGQPVRYRRLIQVALKQ